MVSKIDYSLAYLMNW